ncbi:MAG TPA: PAS domain-containing protein [Rhizomicrobium sp.]|nr:PAS domain-containing protein [Rhizomicrobium sp.]
MDTRDPHEAAAAYNRSAKEQSWQSVCHAALSFQRRELCALLEIWQSLAQPGRFPRRKDFTPGLLRAYLPNVAIYESIEAEGRRRWRARVMGTRFNEVLGDFTGRFFDDVMPPHIARRWHATPDAALAAGAPLRFVSRLETANRGYITGEYLVAPLLGDDAEANTVLSCGFFGATHADPRKTSAGATA